MTSQLLFRRPLALSPCLAVLIAGTGCGLDQARVSEPEIAPSGSDSGFSGAVLPGFPVSPSQLELVPAPEHAPPPLSGGTLAVSADGKYAVIADPDHDTVHVWSGGAARTVALPAGSEPGRVALDAGGLAHVALRGTGRLARIALADATLAGSTEVCRQPRGVAYDAAADNVSVVCASGKLVTLDAPDHAVQGELLLDPDARDVLVDGAGGFRIARFRSAELTTLDAAGKLLRRAPAKSATRTLFVNSTGPSGAQPQTLAPAVAWRAVASPSGGTWMLHQQSLTGTVQESAGGYGSSCAPVTQAAATEFDSQGNALRVMPVAMAGLSVDMAVSPDGHVLAVASPGAYLGRQGALRVYDTNGAQPELPDGTCGQPLTIPSATDAQITAVAFDGAGLLYAYSREPASLSVYEVGPIDPAQSWRSGELTLIARTPLAGVSARDTGHDLFHMDVGSGLSCASCHGEATDDGRVWDFEASGPRRTQNLRGGLLARAPYHWSGDLPTVQTLLDEVMTKRMGGPSIAPEFTGELGRWLDAQPAPSGEAGAPDAVARGKALFESATVACATCHTGPALTNHLLADVGTGGKFKVPSLTGLALRPPYMHDGCAATLEARFTAQCGGGDKHGKTSQLSAAERADLVAYLASL